MIDLSVFLSNPELAKNIRIEVKGEDLMEFASLIHRLALMNAKELGAKANPYITPAEFAAALRISEDILKKWDKKGITKPFFIGDVKMYMRNDFENLNKDINEAK